jgi:hypothetical protein
MWLEPGAQCLAHTCCPAACARAAVRLLIGASSARLSAPRPRRLVSAGGRELGGAGRAGAGPGEEEPGVPLPQVWASLVLPTLEFSL